MAKTTKAAILRQLQAARTHEENERGKGRRAVSVHYDRGADLVMMELSNGFGFPTSAIPALAQASTTDLAAVRLSPGGGSSGAAARSAHDGDYA